MDFSEITGRQRAFFLTGATHPYAFRVEALKKLRKAIQDNEGSLHRALMEDLHKSESESYLCETGIILEEIRFHIHHLQKWMQKKYVHTPLAQFRAKSYISPEPYGIALILAPWNYPLQLCLLPLIGAISGGNCAVIKPSAYAPATSKAIAKLIAKTFPSEYITVVEGGREENKALLQQKFDTIFFTGSVAVGKTVMEAAAKNLTPVTLELGGKSPVIVDETADITAAARRIAFGKVLNAGQTCVAPDYLLIHKSKKEEFIEAYQKALEEFFPNNNREDMVHIISQKHYKRLINLLSNQKILIGGKSDDVDQFISPTLLDETDPDSPIMQEEIFGPILPLLCFDTLNDAITFIQNRPKPLALYLFTTKKAVIKTILQQCSFGGGCVNDTIMHVATSYLPFGGVGNSGMGNYHGRRSFETFTHERSIIEKKIIPDLPLRYMPYTKEKDEIIHKFLR